MCSSIESGRNVKIYYKNNSDRICDCEMQKQRAKKLERVVECEAALKTHKQQIPDKSECHS